MEVPVEEELKDLLGTLLLFLDYSFQVELVVRQVLEMLGKMELEDLLVLQEHQETPVLLETEVMQDKKDKTDRMGQGEEDKTGKHQIIEVGMLGLKEMVVVEEIGEMPILTEGRIQMVVEVEILEDKQDKENPVEQKMVDLEEVVVEVPEVVVEDKKEPRKGKGEQRPMELVEVEEEVVVERDLPFPIPHQITIQPPVEVVEEVVVLVPMVEQHRGQLEEMEAPDLLTTVRMVALEL